MRDRVWRSDLERDRSYGIDALLTGLMVAWPVVAPSSRSLAKTRSRGEHQPLPIAAERSQSRWAEFGNRVESGS